MYEYKYERIRSNGFVVLGVKYEQHRDLIIKYGKEGYRFVGFVPVEIIKEGFPIIIDLVFEKEMDDTEE